MRRDENVAVTVGRRVDGAFRAPEFDDARAERVLTAAYAVEGAGRRARGRSRGVGLAIALAACAVMAAAVVVLPAVRSGNPPADPATVSSARRAATNWSVAEGWGMSQYSPDTSSGRASLLRMGSVAPTPAGRGLWLSTELVSEPAVAGDRLAVRLTLTNYWGPTVHWRDFGFGLSVTTTFQPDPTMPDGIGIGGMEAKRAVPGRERPLTLGAGESTTTIMSTAVPAGIWQVVGSYAGGGLSRATPPIEIHVRKRTP